MRYRHAALVVSVFTLACADPGTLDAHFEFDQETSHAGVGGTTERGQSFTVENSGQLVQLDLWLRPATIDAPLEVFIVPVVGDIPGEDADIVARAVVQPADMVQEPMWVEVDFSGEFLYVEPGERYAWTVSSPRVDSWNYGLLGADFDEDGNPYWGGGMCDRVTDNYPWGPCEGSGDYGFRVWVDDSPE